MRSFTRLTALIVALATLVFAFGAGTATAKPPARGGTVSTPHSGTLADGSTLVGTFDVTRFVASNGQLEAVGTVTGTATDAAGVTTPVTDTASAVVDLAASTGSCQILDLVLGPLNLDVLGLVVTLDTVHLNITAQQGPGNLLGNLLCAVAGLLDGPAPLANLLNGITALLNQILGALG
jgi:hypothetical protein